MGELFVSELTILAFDDAAGVFFVTLLQVFSVRSSSPSSLVCPRHRPALLNTPNTLGAGEEHGVHTRVMVMQAVRESAKFAHLFSTCVAPRGGQEGLKGFRVWGPLAR